jgi:hypothetical protein
MELKDEWILYLKSLKEGRELREDGFGKDSIKVLKRGNERWKSAVNVAHGNVSIEWDIRDDTILDCYLGTGEFFKGDTPLE